LCRRYWSPLHHFIRSRGYTEAEAKDLTQEFLLHLIEHSTLQRADRLRGRFRSFLLGALLRFLGDEQDRRHAQKRGGGAAHLDIENQEINPATSDPGSVFFDREWALVILENALNAVQQIYEAEADHFGVLQQFLPGSIDTPSYEDAATKLGLTLPALKSELHRLRQRFKAAVRQEVANTVAAPHEIDQEMSYLQSVLMDKGSHFVPRAKPSSANP
jgi:RNA polymerase sigma-70 factor (ECF subfamily)